jgi:hypothetical protein
VATSPVKLPSGFQLEDNQQKKQPNLPPGFVLEGEQAPQPSGPPANAGFTLGNIAKNAWEGGKELVKGTGQLLSDVGGVILPQKLGGDPITDTQLMHHIVDPMQAEAAKARQGGPGSFGHAIASGIPLIGPYAANLGEQAGSGDVGGALAKGLTQYAAPNLISKAAPLVSKAAGRAVLLGKTPEAAYESALKPSTTLGETERAQIVQTGLKNEIPVSKAGHAKIGDTIDAINQKVKDTIATDPTRPISPLPALQNLNEVRGRFQTQVNPAADVSAVEASGKEFADQLNTGATGPVPHRNLGAAEAQAMKQGTYRALGDKNYTELKGASVEAQKGLARGLRTEIAKQFPEIGPLNEAEGKLLDLQPVLERAIARNSNHQAIGIGTPITAATTTAITGSGGIGGAAGILKAVLDNPTVKSHLAIQVSKMANIPVKVARARLDAVGGSVLRPAAALGSDATAKENANQPNQ